MTITKQKPQNEARKEASERIRQEVATMREKLQAYKDKHEQPVKPAHLPER